MQSAVIPDDWQAARSRCDINASEAGEACGLGYRSRAEWVAVRLGERKKAINDEFLEAVMQRGHDDQPFAEYTYVEHILSEEERMLPEAHYRRTLYQNNDVWIVGATPDALVTDREGCLLRTVEYKCSQNDGEGVPSAPRANHLIQCVTQLYVMGLREAHLFYYRRATGVYRCFRVVSDDTLFFNVVWPWLREALEMESSSKARMPKGEIERRTQLLYEAFLLKV
jgi:hypothetical protein